MTVYKWIQTQPCEVQREEGLEVLRKLHIIEYDIAASLLLPGFASLNPGYEERKK